MPNMRKQRNFFQRYGLLLPVVFISVVLIGLVAYGSGLVGVITVPVASVRTPLAATVIADLPTPLAPFGAIDPSLLDYFYDDQLGYQNPAFDVQPSDIQVIGMYLPASGNSNFEFVEPTPLPTPLPYPTSPPLPLPAVPGQPLPTLVGNDETPRTLPYAGESCAPSGLPVGGVLTQRFHVYHAGIDLGVPLGTAVRATHSGKVIFAGWSDVGYGYLVILQNGPFITYYAHNTSFNVTVDQLVGKGSIIAWSGSTGNSSGPHVHYETRINDIPVDPLTFSSRGYSSC